ncbi:hypothetical protein BDW02DRAFT_629070 [Decorospora gaudefroyi]|uniref:Lysine-specific metallo-endopeptidase domain-containing protein n=1 Tax=Decorospora gaudefroyi TaxID=184978 RepID=A0A6A5KQX6_9PLEO|nr:hypothetical protein BDW02DRAFT_629070 [Decorospora gaudefroyi]
MFIMWSWLFLSLLLYCSLPVFVKSYKIDQSCEDKGIMQDVHNAMESAFIMVQSAIDSLAASPLDADTIELLGFLYAKKGDNPAQLIQQGKLAKTLRILRNINTNMRTEVIGDATPSGYDVIIFCHYDRFVEIDKTQNIWRDSVTDYLLRFDDVPCRGSTMDRIALAVTINPVSDPVPVHDADPETEDDADPETVGGRVVEYLKPTQIQLCLWFVDWVKNKEFKQGGDVQKRTKIGRFVIKLAESKGFGLAQIDAYSLLDKVLLHEMTHGRGAYERTNPINGWLIQEGLIDVPSATSVYQALDWAAYGWTGAMKIAKSSKYMYNLGDYWGPDNNADTLALFGSVCKLMNHGSERRKVDSKGRIVPKI